MAVTETSQLQILNIEDIEFDEVKIREAQVESKDYQMLKESIRRVGVDTPISVRPKKDSAGKIIPGKFLGINGCQRYSICTELGLNTMPAIVSDKTDEEARGQQLYLNKCVVRQTRQQERNQIKMIMAEHPEWTNEQIAQCCGMSGALVSMILGLDRLCSEAEQLLADGELKATKAIFLARVPPERQPELFEKAQTESTEDFRKTVNAFTKAAKKASPTEDVVMPKFRKKEEVEARLEVANENVETLTPDTQEFAVAAAEYNTLQWVLQVDEETLAKKKEERKEAKQKRQANKSLDKLEADRKKTVDLLKTLEDSIKEKQETELTESLA